MIGPGSEEKWSCLSENSPQGVWDNIAERMLLEFAESGQLHCPGVFSKQRTRKTVDTFYCGLSNNCDYFSHHCFCQVANMCEEFETHQDREGQLDVLMGQSIVLSEIKAEVLLDSDIPLHQNLLFQQYEERIVTLSQQDKLSKFCMGAGFLTVVENGQYFMTKDTAEFSQFNTVACREYTLPRRRRIKTKRMDPRERQTWARIRSCNQLLAP